MNTSFLSLGSNEGNRQQYLQQAVSLIAARCGVVVQTSSIYSTAAWGLTNQPGFLNIAIQLQTSLAAIPLLHTLQQIEHELGRQRTIKWGPRTIDIDLLFYNNDIISSPELTVPHLLLQDRQFVLIPLAEIAPDYIHPLLQKNIQTLLKECPDTSVVEKLATV